MGKVSPDDNGWVKMCREATYRMNSMFGVLYRAGAFLSRNEASFVSSQGLEFLRTYAKMASDMFNEGRQWLFPLYPKLHIFHHVVLEVMYTAEDCGTCCSPMMFGCQMDEDTVGRASRLSRRVNIRVVSGRTLDRYLVSANSAFSKAGLLG